MPPESKGIINQDQLKSPHKPLIPEEGDAVAVKDVARAALCVVSCDLLSCQGFLSPLSFLPLSPLSPGGVRSGGQDGRKEGQSVKLERG